MLLALEGFNSQIYPIQVGARGGRGYGRMEFEMGAIYRLEQDGVEEWIRNTLHAEGTDTKHAGFFGLPKLTEAEQEQKIKDVKDKLIAAIGG